MKIQPYLPLNAYQSRTNPNRQQAPNPEVEKSDAYVPGEKHQVVTYGKKILEPGQNEIEKLKEKCAAQYNDLRRMVEELLSQQGYILEKIEAFEGKTVKIDETQRENAAELISEKGPLGAEAVSDRIVDFAIAISGGDKAKLGELKKAITEGFNQVKDILGKLPEVSTRTYDLVMEKLDAWGEEQPHN